MCQEGPVSTCPFSLSVLNSRNVLERFLPKPLTDPSTNKCVTNVSPALMCFLLPTYCDLTAAISSVISRCSQHSYLCFTM